MEYSWSKKNNFIWLLFTLIVIIAFVITCLSSYNQSLITTDIDQNSVISFNENWKYQWEGKSEAELVNLPNKTLGGNDHDILRIYNKLPEVDKLPDTLLLRTSQQYCRVLIDGKEIYQFGNLTNANDDPPGSMWHFIKLPEQVGDGNIEIALMSPYNKYTGNINEISIGSKSDLIVKQIKTHMLSLVIGGINILFGAILIFFYLFLRSKKDELRGAILLGLFSILTGIWIIAESKIIQFLINNVVLVFNMAWMASCLLPITLLLFITTVYKPSKAKLLRFMAYTFAVFFFLVLTLSMFNVVEIINILFIYHTMLFSAIILLLYVSIGELMNGNKRIKLFFYGCIILAVSSLGDIYFFYFSSYSLPGLNAQVITQFGVLTFVFMMSGSLAHLIIDLYNKQARSEIYEVLAYTDKLTGLRNRTFFDERIEYFNDKIDDIFDLKVLVLDLNNLKETNDNYGHKEGDRLIHASAEIIGEIFSDVGETFRIGGDEFVIIIEGKENLDIDEILQLFNSRLDEYNQINQIEISIAVGCGAFIKDIDGDIDSVFNRADKSMYRRKNEQKKIEKHLQNV